MKRIACVIAAWTFCVLAWTANADDLAPTGTLRATFIDTNSAQAKTDPATGGVSGPAADLTRALAQKLGVPFSLKPARGVAGVMESVKNGEADIGFLAYDPVRAAEVDFSQTYVLAQNTYLVPENSPIRVVADVDKPGIRVGVGARDAGDYFLTRTLKHATHQAQRGRHHGCRARLAQGGRGRRLCGKPPAHVRGGRAHARPAADAGQFLRRRTVHHRRQGRRRKACNRQPLPR